MVIDEKDVFVAALALSDAEEREAYLQAACAGDPELLGRLRELLSAHEESQGPLDRRPAVLGVTVDAPYTEGPGSVIGPYKLLQQIGEGGMGTVFMAEQTQPVQRKVALKVIKLGMDSRQVIARFEAERQALAMMDHVNIARVFDGGATENGRPYFVMELVHGVPITKYCDDNHLTPRERLELFVPVCQAIQHAHQKGIIHRDIKPSNVMVTLYDGKPVPKVIDFGVAKATEQKLTERTLFTQYGTLVGTLEYMSPEQAELSTLGVDTRSDIYSLGVLLYELLTGSTPLTHKRMKEAAYAEILRMIKEEEPPKPSTRLNDSGEALASISAQRHMEPAKLTKLVRGELDWIVMKCLEKDRNRRYETANGFATDVQRYLKDESVQACPPSAGYRFRKFARRNKAALLTASVVLLALVGGIIAATWGLLRADAARRDEADQRAIAETRRQDAEAQREQTRKQKERADRNLARARKAVRDYLTATASDPRLQVADLHALRKSLLATAVPFYEEFVMQQADDPVFEAERGRAYGELANVRMNMGETGEALADCKKAEEIFARLAKQYPNEPSHWANVAVSLNQQGLLLKELGRHEEAERAHRNALTIRETLTADYPDAPVYRHELAGTLQHLASLLNDRGKRDEAKKVLKRALDESQRLVGGDPNNPAYLSLLAGNHGNTGIRFSEAGEWEQAQTHLAEARKLFRKLAADHPTAPGHQDDLAVHLMTVGGWHLDLGHWEQAEEDYREGKTIWEKLADKFPSVPSYRHSLARACNNQAVALDQLGKLAEAETVHRQALAIRKKLAAEFPSVPENRADLAGSHQNLGSLLRARGKPAEAKEAYEQAVAIWQNLRSEFPDLADYQVSLGGVYVNLASLTVDGQPEAALAWSDKALAAAGPALAADNTPVKTRDCVAKAHAVRAQALAKLNRPAEAQKEWDHVKALDPALVPPKGARKPSTGKAAAEKMNQGHAAMQKGDYNRAIAEYTEAIRLDPEFPTAYEHRAVAYFNKGDVDRAIADNSAALILAPRAVTYRNRGREYGHKGDHQRAIADFNEALRLEPQNGDAYCDRGGIFLQCGDPDRAIADCAEAIRLKPKLALAYDTRGSAYFAKDEYDKAVADFGKAIPLDPQNPRAYFNRAEAYQKLKRHDLAMADFAAVIRLDPSYAPAYSGRGNAYADTKEYAKAIADFTEALRLDPKSVPFYLMRGITYGEMGKHDAAVADYGTAIRLDPKNPAAYAMRAAAYRALGDKAKAEADERKAQELDARGGAGKPNRDK